MRIACVDKSAADRLALLEILDDCFAQCRNVIGHVSVFQPAPVSREELLVNARPDAVIVGPQFASDEAFLLCRDLRRAHADLPILVLVRSEIQSFQMLQRFETVASGVFAAADEAARIVHCLCVIATRQKQIRKAGKLVAISGVKGGVGATSLAGGFAHAAEACGLTAILFDLSPTGALALYMLAAKRQSSDFASFLLDGTVPDAAAVQRCIATAPNGINLLLPPCGGTEVRETWLRSPERFEISLAVIDILTELYDLVLVDLAGVEGVLQYALSCRAAVNVLISSHDPAAVHLLGNHRNALAQLPGNAELQILINEVAPAGLPDEDIIDFLCVHCAIAPEEVKLTRIPHDARGRAWVGTGNSFYTESSRPMQRRLEEVVARCAGKSAAPAPQQSSPAGMIEVLRRLAQPAGLRRKKTAVVPLLMPPSTADDSPQDSVLQLQPEAGYRLESLYQPAALQTEN